MVRFPLAFSTAQDLQEDAPGHVLPAGKLKIMVCLPSLALPLEKLSIGLVVIDLLILQHREPLEPVETLRESEIWTVVKLAQWMGLMVSQYDRGTVM